MFCNWRTTGCSCLKLSSCFENCFVLHPKLQIQGLGSKQSQILSEKHSGPLLNRGSQTLSPGPKWVSTYTDFELKGPDSYLKAAP